MKILILGASYGSLLSTKLLMAGHDVSLVCLPEEAALINASGTKVRIKLRDEDSHREILSAAQKGTLNALTPADADPTAYDMIGLAMQEPQYSASEIAKLLKRIGDAGKPCLSIMNMPPLAYLRRIPSLADIDLTPCYADASVWDALNPSNVTLCSPDPQAFRPPDEALNVLHVGLPTNFKAAAFENAEHNDLLNQLSADVEAVSLDGKQVPVKLRVHQSLFVPMAKWAMLLTGNYRCIESTGIKPIKEAVHGNVALSKSVYTFVQQLVEKLGADPSDAVPFEKYANAAEGLLKPSSAARGIDAGAKRIERVDRIVQIVAKHYGLQNDEVDRIVRTVDARLKSNNTETETEPA